MGDAWERVQIFSLAEGLKIEGFLHHQVEEAVWYNFFCQSCVHFHLAHVAVHMVLRLVIQGCPTLEGTPLEILFSVSDAMKKTNLLLYISELSLI